MTTGKKIVYAFLAGMVPMLLYAFAGGPDARYTAAPGDNPNACANAGCHSGLAKGGPINAAGGAVTATFSSGTSYTPGQAVTITVNVTDPVNTLHGFQMTARLESNLSTAQAGRFSYTTGTGVFVLCDNNVPRSLNGNCPANFPVEFIEHNAPRTGTWTFTWTPPATNQGPVHFYIAGNAVNGDSTNGPQDHVYTASYVLTPGTSNPPVITSATTASGTTGSAFSYQITATNSPSSYGATGLPSGLSLNTASGLISGTPTASGTSTVGLSATNSGGTGNANLTLTISSAPPAPPVITEARGIEGWGGATTFSSGSWLQIKGSNFTDTAFRQWIFPDDFTGNNAPTSLGGVSVTVNNKPAFVNFISPGQVNVAVPDDTAVGSVPVVVTSPKGVSNTFMAQRVASAPGLLAPPSTFPFSFFQNGKQYLEATIGASTTFVGNPNFVPNFPFTFRPAKPGDSVLIYAIGLGDVDPALPAGVVAGADSIKAPVTISFDQTPATITYKGHYPTFIGLYFLAVTVPEITDGDHQSSSP